ncbi:hypothetical protein [Candidatus Mycoplasma haematohominis]|uniref:hypothetical protein n=1 Tax=Candidatus Mycoplasma haematohominis TaxID=1494318 RepID=UPI001C0A6C91|nr:hypothetical protein [Candidatus Mycoplasma haemohominis]
MDIPDKLEIKSAKAQKIIVELEELFDPSLSKSVKIWDRFHATLTIESNACDLESVKEGFMPLADFCKTWIPRGARAYVMKTPSNIPAIKDFKIVCVIDSAIWAAFKVVRNDFQIGKTVDLIGAWGQILEYKPKSEKYFIFALVPLTTYDWD